MGYTKELQTKIIKTIHVIDIFEGSMCCDIKGYLARVPDGARIVSVEEDGVVGGKYYLKFEQLEEQNGK